MPPQSTYYLFKGGDLTGIFFQSFMTVIVALKWNIYGAVYLTYFEVKTELNIGYIIKAIKFCFFNIFQTANFLSVSFTRV